MSTSSTPTSSVKPTLKPKPRDPEESPKPTAKTPAAATSPSQRLLSLDAYRGFIMIMMASAGFGIPALAKKQPGPVTDFLANQLSHAEWTGYAFWDLIQPAFMFMVGVAMTFSYAARSARGDSFWKLSRHAIVRAVVLVFLGTVVLHNTKHGYLFTNVLSQIGLGYVFLFLLWNCKVWIQGLVGLAVLALYGWVFYEHPLPPRVEWPNYGITEKSVQDGVILEGEKAPWSKNINFAADVDRAFLNLLPRPKEFRYNEGGYQTLNFVPALVTMIFGLMAGELLRSDRSSRAKLLWLIGAGVLSMAAGVALDMTILPSVKRIWTPAWVFVSGAWALWMLAAFYAVIEMRGWRRWAMPLVVVGANSIVIYMMSQLLRRWFGDMLETHIHSEIFTGAYGPVIEACSILAVMWLLCWWMYRQKIFVRI